MLHANEHPDGRRLALAVENSEPLDVGRRQSADLGSTFRGPLLQPFDERVVVGAARIDREYGDGRGGIFLTYIMEPDDKSGWIGGDVWFDAYPAPCA